MNLQEQEQTHHLQRGQRKKKKQKRRFRPIRFIMTLVLLTAVVVSLALSPLFLIKGIEVQGSSHYGQQEVIGMTGLVVGNNAFKSMGTLKSMRNEIKSVLSLRYSHAEKVIRESFPYVKEAKVQYVIPGKIIIRIIEREPKYVLALDASNLLMDGEGYIVDTVKDIKNVKLPVVRGLKFDRFEVGQALKPDDSKSLTAIEKLRTSIEESETSEEFKLAPIINYIDASDLKKISIMVDSRIIVDFGDLQDLNYRIKVARHIFQKVLGKQDKGTLDFTSGNDPMFKPDK